MDEENNGPIMLVATNMMRPPQTRIGRIGKDITLPRTIPLASLLAGGAGLVIGLLFAMPFGTFEGFAFGGIVGAVAGVAAVTMSPMKGESFAKWLGLNVANIRAQKVRYNGLPAKVYIGIAPLRSTALGRVRVVSGSVDVVPGSVDERGVFFSSKEALAENRVRAAEFVARHGGSLPSAKESKSLPPSTTRTLTQAGKKEGKASGVGKRVNPVREVEAEHAPLPSPEPPALNPWVSGFGAQPQQSQEQQDLASRRWGHQESFDQGNIPSQRSWVPAAPAAPPAPTQQPETRRSRREAANRLPANSKSKPLTRRDS